jgi:outer membrane cobalamin receptor
LSYSYLDSKEVIPFAPNKINFLFNYKMHRLNFSLYGEYINNLYSGYQLLQFPPKTTVEKFADYTLVHLKINYLIMKNVNLSLGIENLLNESYEILKGYPMPGATFISSINYSL